MTNRHTPGWAVLIALPALIAFHCGAQPMIPADLAILNIKATQPLASEPGNNPAVFTITRWGDTNSALTVPLSIGGSASNGVDYAAISNSINLAAGQTSTTLTITPVSETNATKHKTVVLALHRARGEATGSNAFRIGFDNRAVAYITYNYSNIPPSVTIASPTNGMSYYSLPNIEITANAADSNGWVTSVQFLANGKALGVISNSASFQPWEIFPMGRHSSRYEFVWTNVPPGSYALTAVATDNAGLQGASAAVNITVTTNLPAPVVKIVSPQDGAQFFDLAPVNIYAAAAETNGVIDRVAFLGNGTNLGIVSNYLAAGNYDEFRLHGRWVPYFFQWTNAPVGSNILEAIATDNNGTSVTSAPVSILVTTNTYTRRHHYY